MTHSPALWLASTPCQPDLDREGGVSFHGSAEDAWRALWSEHFDGATPEEVHDIITDLGQTVPSTDPALLSVDEIAGVLESLPEFTAAVIRVPSHAPAVASEATCASVAA